MCASWSLLCFQQYLVSLRAVSDVNFISLMALFFFSIYGPCWYISHLFLLLHFILFELLYIYIDFLFHKGICLFFISWHFVWQQLLSVLWQYFLYAPPFFPVPFFLFLWLVYNFSPFLRVALTEACSFWNSYLNKVYRGQESVLYSRLNSSCLYDMGFMCECDFLAFTFLLTPLPSAFWKYGMCMWFVIHFQLPAFFYAKVCPRNLLLSAHAPGSIIPKKG